MKLDNQSEQGVKRDLTAKKPLTVSDQELASAAIGFDQFLVRARHAIGPDVTALRLHILLNVFAHEGINQRGLLTLLDLTSVTALSRNLADMSALTSAKKPGPGLIELRFDPMNLRQKSIHLTQRGRKIISQILQAAA
jgi:DNA-binding MarR family transcriptional regulator